MVEAWKNKGRRVMLRTLLMGYAGLRKYGGVNLGRVLLHVRKITQVSGWKRLKGRLQLPTELLLQLVIQLGLASNTTTSASSWPIDSNTSPSPAFTPLTNAPSPSSNTASSLRSVEPSTSH